MPMCQVQLKSTARRSLAPGAGRVGWRAVGPLRLRTGSQQRADREEIRASTLSSIAMPRCRSSHWRYRRRSGRRARPPVVTDLRNPNGLPFLAGNELHGDGVPGLEASRPVLPIPLCARVVAEPVVITQSVVEPSGFLTASVSDPWGFVSLMLDERPRHLRLPFSCRRRPRGNDEPAASQLAISHPHKTTHPKIRPIIRAPP